MIGAGGHALVCAEVLTAAGFTLAGCVSADGSASADIERVGLRMLGRADDWLASAAASGSDVFVAIGDNRTRSAVSATARAAGATIVSAVSPRSIVSPSAGLGAGVLVMPGAVINAAARVADGVIVNTNACVDHECTIGAFAHLAPGSLLAGGVVIGDGAFIGVGAAITPGRTIGEWAVVGAGAAVISDVAADAVVAGVPARPIERRARRISARDDQTPRVLVVCTGNLCRSPLAATLLQRGLDAAGIEASIASAGTMAPPGATPDRKLLRVAAERGLDLSHHRAEMATWEMVHDADLILTMSHEHAAEVEAIDPSSTRSSGDPAHGGLEGEGVEQRRLVDPGVAGPAVGAGGPGGRAPALRSDRRHRRSARPVTAALQGRRRSGRSRRRRARRRVAARRP